MTESKKEEASAAKTQKKSAISDEFGNDFLSSWKSMSVAEDDGLDFNQEVLPKGKKNMFNFDKLDMDFSLDGDFGKKMSSFNVDMSDLDFSSPAKKPSKAKEGSTEESLDGKQGGKQSRFNLSFDFNELDNFDFDSNFMKGKSKSEKAADLEGFDSPRKPEKAPSARNKPAAGVELPENSDTDKTPVSQHLNTSKFEHLDSSGKFNANISSFSTSADFGISSQTHSTASPVKETTVSRKETAQSSQQSERTSSTERKTQNTVQGSSSQSFSMGDSVQDAAFTQGEVCSSGTEDKTSQEEVPDMSVKGCDRESSQPVRMSGPKSAENGSKKMLEKQSDMHIGDASGDDSMQGGMNNNDSSAGNSAQKMLHGTVLAKETYVKSKLNFEVLQSGDKACQPEKETVDIQREYVSRSVETESQLNPSDPKKACSVSSEKVENEPLRLADAKSKPTAPQSTKQKESSIQSKHFSASIETESQLNTQSIPKKAGSVSNKRDENLHLGSLNARSEPKARQPVKEKGSSTVQSKYFNKSVETGTQLNSQSISEKARHVSSKLTDNMHSNPADLRRQQYPAIDAEGGNHRINNSKSQEREVKKGASVALGNGKNGETNEMSSRLPEKTVKPTAPQSLNSKLVSSISSIRNSKNNSVEGNKVPPLHSAKITLEASSLKVSRLAAISHPKALISIKSPRTSTVSMEKRILISPHTKRKMSEPPDADPVLLQPLKRAAPSPNQCRGLEETSKRLDKKMVHSSPIPEVPRDEGWKELQQVPLLMEDDGNIEKAEAYSKELDDICNMLKKKHDEAKELLVRAIVSNNQLLMLNHPIYLEKIRMVEQFANLMLSPARQI